MSSILGNRKRKDTKLTYKQLWETELNNRKMYEKQYKDLHERYVELQKGTELPKLRLQIRQLSSDLQDMTTFKMFEEIAKNKLLYREMEIREWLEKNDDNSMYEKSTYLHEIINGEHDEKLKEKWQEKEEEKKDGEN